MEKYGTKIWEENNFSIWRWNGMLYLYKGEINIARKGESVFIKNKLTVRKWIDQIRKKDLKLVETWKGQIEEIKKGIQHTLDLWEIK